MSNHLSGMPNGFLVHGVRIKTGSVENREQKSVTYSHFNLITIHSTHVHNQHYRVPTRTRAVHLHVLSVTMM